MGLKGVTVMPEPANADAAYHFTIIRHRAGDWTLRHHNGNQGDQPGPFGTLDELLRFIPAAIAARTLDGLWPTGNTESN